MKPIDKTILVRDYGSYTVLLPALVKAFTKVQYYLHSVSSYETSPIKKIGKGIEGVEHIAREIDFFRALHEVKKTNGVVAFFDCKEGGYQADLVMQGYNVWGSMEGEEIENNRFEANEILKEVGLPSVTMERVYGIKALRTFLKENDNIYVKGNSRGNFETFKSINYKLIEPKLDDIEHKLSVIDKDDFEFICCTPIDGDDIVEIGTDGFFIGKQYPQKLLYGYEIKDCGYVGTVKNRNLISKILIEPLEKLAPIFEQYNYRGNFSDEIRVGKDRKPYVTDPTNRVPSPPGELEFNMITNLGEVIDKGSQGIFVEPTYSDKYGVEAIIKSDFAENNCQPIYFPDEIKDHVVLKHWSVKDKTNYYVYDGDVNMVEIGAVWATGATLEAAIKKLKEYCEQVEGYCVYINTDSMVEDAIAAVKKGMKIGITF